MESSSYNLTIWNRLNSRARKKDFSANLKAEIRDPLWMLSRQWQFGEFEAEDTGAPVFACVEWNNTQIGKLALGDQGQSKDISQEVPLETEVESVKTEPDFYLRIEMGRHWFRLLKRKLAPEDLSSIITAFKNDERFHFKPIPDQQKLDKYDNAHLLNNEPLIRFLDASMFGKMLDGKLLFDALQISGQTASQLIGVSNTLLDEVGQDFIKWFRRRYSQPESESTDGWKPERLEYQFATAAPKEEEKEFLISKEYFQGRLDWYAFDIDPSGASDLIPDSLGQDLNEALVKTGNRKHFIPSEIAFPGMPKARWWEFEDRKLNFSAINANLSDTAKMVLTEFAFLYSNDWFMLPFHIPVGSLLDAKQIVVTDSFGQRTCIKHYNQTAQASPHWSFFKLDHTDKEGASSNLDQQLFIPPVVIDLQESKPLEEVNFTRDEMANFVWGIETIVPDGLGQGINGTEYAKSMQSYYEKLVEAYPVDDGSDAATDAETVGADPNIEKVKADIQYKIATSVPENWIPFIPKHKSESEFIDIHFQRAAMPRVFPGFPIVRVRPVTRLLRHGLDTDQREPYFICEEEIPRAGTIVLQSWQRTRWHDGRVVLWLGYRKANGRGEAASGLKFDQAIEKQV